MRISSWPRSGFGLYDTLCTSKISRINHPTLLSSRSVISTYYATPKHLRPSISTSTEAEIIQFLPFEIALEHFEAVLWSFPRQQSQIWDHFWKVRKILHKNCIFQVHNYVENCKNASRSPVWGGGQLRSCPPQIRMIQSQYIKYLIFFGTEA